MSKPSVLWMVLGTVAAAALGAFMLVGGPEPEPVALTAAPPSPPDSSTVEVVLETGGAAGYSYAVAVSDSSAAADALAVFGRGAELVVVDVSSPRSPTVLGSLALPGEIRDVVLGGTSAFVAADTAGLQIVDLSTPSRPIVRTSRRFDDRAEGVYLDGGHVYVAARSQGLRILDASNPSSPVEIGHIITPDEAVDVVVRDGYAYVSAWYESMRVIDVSDPTAPEEVSFASYDSYDNGAAWTVSVVGDIGLNTIPEMGLRTVDISNPRDVKLYKVYRGLFAPAGVAARGRIAYVADQAAGFRVLDLTEPASLAEIGSLELPGTPLAVALSGDYAYVASREAGLRIVDISRPNAPQEVAYLDADDEIADVVFDGQTLFAAGAENGIYRVDGSGMVAYAAGSADRVSISDGRIVVAGKDGVRFYDRDSADPTEPARSLSGPARGVAVRGDVTVTAAGPEGIRLFDGSGQMAELLPERVAKDFESRARLLEMPVESWDVVLGGDTAYVAFDDGIRAVDISNLTRPEIVRVFPTPQRVFRLAATGSMLLAACDDGLRIFDRMTGREISYIKTPSFATAIAVSDGRVYVGDLGGTVTIVDLSQSPRVIGVFEVADRVRGLSVRADEIAVAAGLQGVRIVRGRSGW